MDIHIQRLRRCVILALKGAGKQKTNPLVGCSIYENNELIAEGWHPYFGGPHAEVVALDQCQPKKDNYRQLYVTLEPCAHYGKTPPCANRIIADGVDEVHIGIQDPNPQVCGKGIALLKSAGIKVFCYDYLPAFAQLIRPFSLSLKEKRPYIILKWAESAYGYIGLQDSAIRLSNTCSNKKVHILRNKVDMIFAGNRTLVNDNPAFTSRVPPFHDPAILCINLHGTAPQTWIKENSEKRDFFYVTHNNDPLVDKLKISKSLQLPTAEYNSDNWKKILDWLYNNHVGTLLVEGGSQVFEFLIAQNLWDEAIQIKTQHFLQEGIKAPNIPGNPISFEVFNEDHWIFYANNAHKDSYAYALTI